MTSPLLSLAQHRALRQARHAYLAAARTAAPALAAQATDDDLVRIGTSLLAMAALGTATDDPHAVDHAIIGATEWGATRAEMSALFVVAGVHLGPALGVGPVTVIPLDTPPGDAA